MTLGRGWTPPSNELAVTGGDHYSFNFHYWARMMAAWLSREAWEGDASDPTQPKRKGATAQSLSRRKQVFRSKHGFEGGEAKLENPSRG